MAPNKWDEEDSESDTPPSSPPPVARRSKFDDEDEDSDVLESWDAADDSEAEREKAKKAAEAKAKAEAEAKANHKSRGQRIQAHKAANAQRRAEADDSSDEDEDDAERRARLRREQKDADLKHAEDLFGDLSIAGNSTRGTNKHVTLADPSNPNETIDLSALPIFNPQTKDQFTKLRDTLIPLIGANVKKAHYTLFMQEFAKQLCKDMPSDQIKKVASGLTTLSNEKMKEEKAAEKGGKKSKAAKTKTSLNANRDITHKADTSIYEDGLDDGDFM